MSKSIKINGKDDRLADLLTDKAWKFIEKHYPDYYQSDEIAHHDDLQKIVDEEEDKDSHASNLLREKYRGDRMVALQDKILLEHDLMIRAIENFESNKKECSATLYREDYDDYGWYYLLLSLGIIKTNHTEIPIETDMTDLLKGDDLKIFNSTNQVKVVRR